MATQLTDLTQLTDPALADQVYIVDASDTTDDAAGSSKRILLSDLIKAIGGKVPLETITLSTAGEFDFGPALSGGVIPSGYKRLIIRGHVRSDGNIASGVDEIHVAFNADETATNYRYQANSASGGVSGFGAGNDALCGHVTGLGSPADAESLVDAVIENYTGSAAKAMLTQTTGTTSTTSIRHDRFLTHNNTLVAAITRLRIRAVDHPTDGLTGELTLYGEL